LIGRHPPTLKKAEMVEPLPKKGKSAKIKVQIRRV